MANDSNNGSNPAALAKRDDEEITGTSIDAKVIDDKLRRAQGVAHLVAPATRCDVLPAGCAVVTSALYIDEANETYPLKGGRGLSKTALNKIAVGLGVSWDPHASCRLDDGSDPHYCHYRAVGYYKSFDGQRQLISGEKQLDLRNGSAQLDALEASSKKGDASAQIREMRAFILEHAETKARNRAIRSAGLKTSYTSAELRKPFVMARLMFTGQTDDPTLKHAFGMATAQAMLGGQSALYGQAPTPSALQQGGPPPTPPPPLPERKPGEEYDGETGEFIDAKGEPSAPAPAEPPPLCLPDADKTPIPSADTAQLERWQRRISEDLQDQIPPADEVGPLTQCVEAIVAELARRSAAPTAAAGGY